MAKFLNTSATNYFIEELIKGARDRLVLISPYLQFNDRVRELLEDKNRLKIDVRIVYGKSELKPEEINWLEGLSFVRTSFCKNLHAKCYLNEEICIVTSLNLYEFSQVNNNEMGVLFRRSEDAELYRDAYDEAQRLIRISDEIRMSVETVGKKSASADDDADAAKNTLSASEEPAQGKISTSKLAQKLGLKNSAELLAKLTAAGYLAERDGRHCITDSGKSAGGELKFSQKYGSYFLWPAGLDV